MQVYDEKCRDKLLLISGKAVEIYRSKSAYSQADRQRAADIVGWCSDLGLVLSSKQMLADAATPVQELINKKHVEAHNDDCYIPEIDRARKELVAICGDNGFMRALEGFIDAKIREK